MCAIIYHAGRRIQGLSTDATTVTNSTVSSLTDVVFDADTMTGSITYSGNEITLTGSTSWVNAINANFQFNNTGTQTIECVAQKTGTSAWIIFGLASAKTVASSDMTTQMEYGIRSADDGRTWIRQSSGNWTQVSNTADNVTFKIVNNRTTVTYYANGSSIGTTTHGTPNATYYPMMLPAQTGTAGSYVFDYSGDIITTTTGVKPANVQVGSRFEETDTKKMYHYNEDVQGSQDFASVLSTYAPQFFLKLDEGSGTSLTNSGSSSGYTASITVANSNPVWDTGVGGANKALKFVNTIDSPTGKISHSQLPTETTGDNFTMGFTFKVPSSLTGGDSNNHHLWMWDASGLGFWQMNMSNDGYISSSWFNGGWQHVYGTTDVADNAWHTFFITCTSGSSLKGYLDGTQEFTGTANRSGYAGNDVDTLHHTGGRGTILYDNAFFKNSVLTASEISSLHDLLVPALSDAWEEEGT